jgi:hypothetical protein
MQFELGGIMETIADLLMRIVEPLQGVVARIMDGLSGVVERIGSSFQPFLIRAIDFVGPCMEPCRFLYCCCCGWPALLGGICWLPGACCGVPNLLALSICYPQLLGHLAELCQPLCYL